MRAMILGALTWLSCGSSPTSIGERTTQAAASEPSRPTNPPARLDDLRSRILGHYGRLATLAARIHSWHRDNPAEIVHTIVAAKQDARFELLWHGDVTDLERDPQCITRCYSKGTFDLLYAYERRFETTRQFAVQPYISKVQLQFLFEALGWWPPDDPTPPLRPRGEPEFLIDILKDPRLKLGEDEHDPTLERVLEIPNVVKLWVDREHGFLRRRQQLAVGAEGLVKCTADYRFEDVREYDDDIWLPAQITRDFPLIDYHSIHRLEYTHVNTVTDDLFTIPLPPGTLVYDRDTDTYRQIGGGLDHLEHVVERIPKLASAGGGVFQNPFVRGGAWLMGSTALGVFLSRWGARFHGAWRGGRERESATRANDAFVQ